MDDVENEDGIRCVGAPIFGYSGKVVAAVSVSGPAYRLSAERAREIGAQVRTAAASISRQLGYMR